MQYVLRNIINYHHVSIAFVSTMRVALQEYQCVSGTTQSFRYFYNIELFPMMIAKAMETCW